MTRDPLARVRRIRRIVGRLVLAGIVLGVAWFSWRYDVGTIPEGYAHLMPQGMPPGRKIVLVDYDEDTVVGIGTIVKYRPLKDADGIQYGVFMGLPGERLEVGEGALLVGGRRLVLQLPSGHVLQDGVIPSGHYLVLEGDYKITLHARDLPQDSRRFGLIPADRILQKVVTPLWFFD